MKFSSIVRVSIRLGNFGSKVSVGFPGDVRPCGIVERIVIVVVIFFFSDRKARIVRAVSGVMFGAVSVTVWTLILSTPRLEMSELVAAETDGFAHVARVGDGSRRGRRGISGEVENNSLFCWGFRGGGGRGVFASSFRGRGCGVRGEVS
jgi:hypothetical protein